MCMKLLKKMGLTIVLWDSARLARSPSIEIFLLEVRITRLIGYQGASVAAACITKSHKEQIFHLPFKMAVFMCAALIPPEIASEADLVKTIGSFGNIDIPTVHVIGKRDLCYSQSLQLLKSCTVSSAQSVFNGGGHDVPRDAANTTNICVGIERAARLAFSG